MLMPLILTLSSISSTAWAEHDHRSRGNDDPYKQRPLNFTAEEQRPIIQPHGFSTRQLREWDRGDGNYRDDRYRDHNERNNDWRRVDDWRDDSRHNDDRRGNGSYQRLHDTGSSRYRSQRPVNDVIREVQNRYDGQVIGVQNGDGGMYRVRVLQRDGRVKNVLVPAE